MVLPRRKRRRKVNPNPEIEQLLLLKDKWDDDVSQFIEDLIGAKRGLNGAPDGRLGMQKSRITQPMNPKVTTLLSQLSTRYRDLSNRALEIARTQDELSKKKREPRHSGEQHPSPAPMPNPLMPTASLEPQLTAEGSNKFSRTWYRAKSFFSRDTVRPIKVDLLKISNQARKSVLDLQNTIVSSGTGEKEIENSFAELERLIMSISRMMGLIATRFNQPMTPETSGNLMGGVDPLISKIKFYELEFNAISLMGDRGPAAMFNRLHIQFNRSKDYIERSGLAREIDSLYKDTIKKYNEKYPELVSKWKYFSELYTLVRAMPALTQTPEPVDTVEDVATPEDPIDPEPLEATAHNALTRAIKKLKYNLPFADSGASIKVDLYNNCKDLKKNFNEFLDAIEDEKSLSELSRIFSTIRVQYDQMRREKSILIEMIKNKK